MVNRTAFLPASFDPKFYMSDKPHLSNEAEAYEHFANQGRRLGLAGSPGCNLGRLLNSLQTSYKGKKLEIGPGCSPKLKGESVYYFDVKTKEELVARYRDEVGNVEIPERIDFVDREGKFGNIDDRFELILSSHAIEHSHDFIAHLNDAASILDEGGVYVVVAPDKRFTFDHFKPLTVLEDILAQHLSGDDSDAFALRAVLLEASWRAHNSPQRHWAGDHGEPDGAPDRIDKALAAFPSRFKDRVWVSGHHKWIFTPDSFCQIVNGAFERGIGRLRVLECYNTLLGSMSFTAVLGK